MFYPRFFKLYTAMKRAKVRAKYLADALDISEQCFSRRMNGRTPWSIDECYKVLDYLDIPREYIADYFPPENVEYEVEV